MLSVVYAEFQLYWVSLLLSVAYAECHKLALYAECRFAKCRGATSVLGNVKLCWHFIEFMTMLTNSDHCAMQ